VRLALTVVTACLAAVVSPANAGRYYSDAGPAEARHHSGEVQAGEPRVLDVVAFGRDGRPVTDLRPQDFYVEDNGQPVEIETLTLVPSTDGRMVVLILDDAGVPVQGTQAIQYIARAFVARMRSNDRVSVLRLHADAGTEGGRAAAGQMIDKYVAGVVPFDKTGTPQHVLETVAGVARGLLPREDERRKRKAVVCVGSQAVCSVPEMMDQDPRGLWAGWIDAVGAAAAANIGVYAIVPAQQQFSGGHLPEVTGGVAYATTSEFDRVIDQIWRDLGDYYLLGYRPFSSAQDLTSIKVTVARKDVTLHVRRRRGR
jgi:hypothetical protein